MACFALFLMVDLFTLSYGDESRSQKFPGGTSVHRHYHMKYVKITFFLFTMIYLQQINT